MAQMIDDRNAIEDIQRDKFNEPFDCMNEIKPDLDLNKSFPTEEKNGGSRGLTEP